MKLRLLSCLKYLRTVCKKQEENNGVSKELAKCKKNNRML